MRCDHEVVTARNRMITQYLSYPISGKHAENIYFPWFPAPQMDEVNEILPLLCDMINITEAVAIPQIPTI